MDNTIETKTVNLTVCFTATVPATANTDALAIRVPSGVAIEVIDSNTQAVVADDCHSYQTEDIECLEELHEEPIA